MLGKGILRVIDANFNRYKEGLRVVEDIFRFILCDNALRRRLRKCRHYLDELAEERILKKAILSRSSRSDIGRKLDVLEIKRENISDIVYSNMQRVKEALRVMEEFFKLILPKKVEKIKKLRYEIYTVEKSIVRRWPVIFNIRRRGNQAGSP